MSRLGLLFYIWILSGGLSHASSPLADVVSQEMKAVYEAELKQQGYTLDFRWNKDSSLIVASAQRAANQLQIVVDGGLVESSRLTADGFRFVLCHELGHMLGGAPRRSTPPEYQEPMARDGLSFYSAEGQADYYASVSCFRRLIEKQNHKEWTRSLIIPQDIIDKCEKVWGAQTSASLICQRTIMGGQNMLLLVKDFNISSSTPSTEVVLLTNRDTYPSRQCRLDTMIRGALCKDNPVRAFDFNLPASSECSHPEGVRPACWYKDSTPGV